MSSQLMSPAGISIFYTNYISSSNTAESIHNVQVVSADRYFYLHKFVPLLFYSQFAIMYFSLLTFDCLLFLFYLIFFSGVVP